MPVHRLALAAATATLVVVACHRVPYTGRIQFNFVPDAIMRAVGRTSFQQVLSGAPLDTRGQDYRTLLQVGRNIARAAKQPENAWEFALIDDDIVNAWCMPGGYIGFHSGILPVLRNEAGMAFVMGHEVGHSTARHGAERLSQQLTVIGGLTALEIYVTEATEIDTRTRNLILATLGAGAEVGVLLPFSRTHESEADVIGMMYAAAAGYPPNEFVGLWDRMEQISPRSVPTILSTHPPYDRRRENLREWMPQASKKYDRNRLTYDTTETLWRGASSSDGEIRKHPRTKPAPE